MKKIVSIVLLLVTAFAVSGTCCAIDKEDLSIGGIYYGQPLSEVISMLGQPVDKKLGAPLGRSYLFIVNGANVWVSTSGRDDSGGVAGIRTEGDSGLTTKAGIRYGSTIEEVKRVYGEKNELYVEPGDTRYGGNDVRYVIWYSTRIETTIGKNVYGKTYHFNFGLNDAKKVIWMGCFEERDH